jgi:hypothetical protein
MIHPSIIEARLGELRFSSSRWFKAEIHELQHILMDHEKIIALACGRYFGSFALLVATDQRLLLIDKRVFFMTIEDTRYDMISEIDFNTQAYYANLTIYTVNKTHKFTSVKHRRQLREITNYIQKRVAELRTQQSVPIPGSAQAQAPSEPVQSAAPALGTSYNYSPAITDDNTAIRPAEPERGVAQMVGSAAVQASHHWPRRPLNPYVQGSLMTHRPMSSPSDYY